MLELLNNADQALFYFMNVSLANPVTDWLMPIVTSSNFLRVGYAIAMVLLLWRGDKRLRWLVLFSGIVILLTDQTSSQFLKKLIERPRPCHILEEIHLLVNCGAGYAMPSSHAANAFGQAMFFALATRRSAVYLLPFASLVALSRVFVGVHYPFDIVAGAALGSLLGWIVYRGFLIFEVKVLSIGGERNAV
jgi:undecaprenyl-diphosphatase